MVRFRPSLIAYLIFIYIFHRHKKAPHGGLVVYRIVDILYEAHLKLVALKHKSDRVNTFNFLKKVNRN